MVAGTTTDTREPPPHEFSRTLLTSSPEPYLACGNRERLAAPTSASCLPTFTSFLPIEGVDGIQVADLVGHDVELLQQRRGTGQRAPGLEPLAGGRLVGSAARQAPARCCPPPPPKRRHNPRDEASRRHGRQGRRAGKIDVLLSLSSNREPQNESPSAVGGIGSVR